WFLSKALPKVGRTQLRRDPAFCRVEQAGVCRRLTARNSRPNENKKASPGARLCSMCADRVRAAARLLLELVHGVGGTTCLQRGLAGEVLLVVVADVGAGHVLVLDGGDALHDL